MDFKGITWVGNIYQKFESMCLEVEEIIDQDTVKYVENQVQTVGANVKRFYSDVMQDLLSPSNIDPVKVATPELSLNSVALGVDRNSKTSINNVPLKVDNELPYDSIVCTDLEIERTSSCGELGSENTLKVDKELPDDSIVCIGLEIERTSSCGELGSENNHLKVDKELPDDSIVCTGLEIERTSSCGELGSENNSSDTSSGDAKECNFAEGNINNDIVDANVSIVHASTDSRTSDSILSAELSGTELRHTLTDCLSSESSVTCTDGGLVSHIGSDITADTDSGKSAGEDVFMSHIGTSGDHVTGVMKKNNTTEPGMGTIEQFDKLKLEESCVLVDRNKLCSVSKREDKHTFYKKKIREAFSSKMRSGRKQEYLQLAGQCGDIDSGLKQECVSVTKLSTPADDFCETEWELV